MILTEYFIYETIEVVGAPLKVSIFARNSDGPLLHLVARDLTSRANAETLIKAFENQAKEKEESNARAKEEFIAGLKDGSHKFIHDLRDPEDQRSCVCGYLIDDAIHIVQGQNHIFRTDVRQVSPSICVCGDTYFAPSHVKESEL